MARPGARPTCGTTCAVPGAGTSNPAGAGGIMRATHAEIAVMIGSAREVVSRRLDALARRGIVSLERGAVHIRDHTTLTAIAEAEE